MCFFICLGEGKRLGWRAIILAKEIANMEIKEVYDNLEKVENGKDLIEAIKAYIHFFINMIFYNCYRIY